MLRQALTSLKLHFHKKFSLSKKKKLPVTYGSYGKVDGVDIFKKLFFDKCYVKMDVIQTDAAF